MDTAQIPTVRLDDAMAGAEAHERLVKGLGLGLEWFGFVFVRDHGIEPELLARTSALAERVFALPEASKRRYETPQDGRQRGYTSFGVEHAKDREVGDLKEFWHVGRQVAANRPRTAAGEVPPNRYVEEVPGFSEAAQELFDALDRLSARLLTGIEHHLRLPAGTFEALTLDGNSVLRITHYPPVPTFVQHGAVRDAEHEDIDLITLMPAADEPGLQLRNRLGEWLEVSPPPGTMVCNTGDMMQLLTEGRLPATTYRVVNPPRRRRAGSRISMALYCHPRPDGVLRPARDGAPATTAHSLLMERLRDIGLA